MRSLALLALAAALPLLAKDPLRTVQVVTSEQVDLSKGGTVRIVGSTGQLDVEGWDRPEVEITLAKSTWSRNTPQAADAAKGLLNHFRVKEDHNASGELTITTVYPSWNPITRPHHGKNGVSLQYTIKVPRDAHVVIRHDYGDIRLAGLTGAIEAGTHEGDIELRLPEANPYTIDAKCHFGGVYSDFDGGHRGRDIVGEAFAHNAESSAPHAVLRVGIGGIQILKLPAVATTP